MSLDPKIKQLRELKEKSKQGGGESRIKAQRSKGKLTARERIDRYSYPTLSPAVQAFEKRVESGDEAGRNSS